MDFVCYLFACVRFHLFHSIKAESDIGPSLVLPSISEDDENQSESEAKVCPITPPTSTTMRSPLHTATSPRHAKFLQRYVPAKIDGISGLFCTPFYEFIFNY